jgi:hypothetical protein
MPDKNIRIDEKDHEWLKDNRGSSNMKTLISKIITIYKDVKDVIISK